MYIGTETLDGKTCIVTGANGGIGFITAQEFAKRGARVIMACRSKERGEEARKRIMESTGSEKVVVMELDVSSLKSVRKFAEAVNQQEEHVHILVNNAGVVGKHILAFSYRFEMYVTYIVPVYAYDDEMDLMHVIVELIYIKF